MSAPVADAGGPGSSPGRSRLWQGLLGVVLSIGFLAWALKGVRPGDVMGHLSRANPLWYLASCVAASSTFVLRAVRWRILLAPLVADARLRPIWHATAIGFMANNVLPARAGELVKAYAGTRLVGVPFATSLASIAVERIFDGVTIGILLGIAIGAGGFSGATLGSTTLGALAALVTAGFLGILLFALALVRARRRVLPLAVRALSRVLPARLAPRAERLLSALTDGLAALRSTRDALRVLTWSFALWLVNAFSYVLAYEAFHLEGVPPVSSFLLQGVTALGVAIPAAPGFFGAFEFFAKASLALYGVPGDAAVSLAIGVHLGWFIPITAIGLWYLARTGLHLSELRTPSSRPSPPSPSSA